MLNQENLKVEIIPGTGGGSADLQSKINVFINEASSNGYTIADIKITSHGQTQMAAMVIYNKN